MMPPPGNPKLPPPRTHTPPAGVPLGHTFGIPIRLAPSWFLAFAYLTWMLSAHYRQADSAWPDAARLAVAALTSLLLYASVLAHELGHGIVANALGTPVQRIVLHVLGGSAQLQQEPQRARDELRIAGAGPAVSLALAALLLLVARLAGALHQPVLASPAAWLGRANLALALLNLLPALPLDGGRMLRATIWAGTGNPAAATRAAGHTGRILGLALAIIGGWLLTTGAWPTGAALTLLGWYLHGTGLQAEQHGTLQARLGGRTAADAALTDCPTAHPQDSLELFMHDTLLPHPHPCYPILKPANDTLVGIVTPRQAHAVPRHRWPFTRLEQIMLPADNLPTARPDEPLLDAMQRLQRARGALMPVIDNGHLIGIITHERLQSLLKAPRKPDRLHRHPTGER